MTTTPTPPTKLKEVSLLGETWNVEPIDGGFEIVFAQMYERPTGSEWGGINMALLKSIADHFGTDNIDVDSISQGGCETCEYGSLYGHRIQVRGATRNTDVENTVVIASPQKPRRSIAVPGGCVHRPAARSSNLGRFPAATRGTNVSLPCETQKVSPLQVSVRRHHRPPLL